MLAVVAIVVVVARAGRARARIAANEAAAMTTLARVIAAQAAYAAECGRGNYATSMMDLTTPPPGRREGYLPFRRGELGWTITSEVQGYLFTLRTGHEATLGAADCNEFPTQTRYYAVAVPFRQGEDGQRTFATNQEGVIWEADGLPPPPEPFGPPSRRVP